MTRTRTQQKCFLLLGGHPVYGEAMRLALGRFGDQIVLAASLQDAMEGLDEHEVHGVVVDDDGLGETAALAALSALLGHDSKPKVAVLSGSPSPVFPAEAIRGGASAFLSKQMPLPELHYALVRMAQGDVVVDPAVTRSVLGLLDAPRGHEGNGQPQLYLSNVERRVLRLAAEGKVNKQIATELGLSPLTVKNHVARIRERLKAADKAHAVAIALRSGLLD